MNVLCVGIAVCDILLQPIPKDIMHKDSCFIGKPAISTGGDATNVAITLRKLGADVALSCYVGNDTNGDFIYDRVNGFGIDVSGILRHPVMGTAVTYILIEDNGERHFISHGDMLDVLTDREVPDMLLEKADLVFFGSAMVMKGMDEGGAAALFKKARRLGKLTAADVTGNNGDKDRGYWHKCLAPILRETDLFAPSYDEAVLITGERDLRKIRDAFSQYGLKYLAVKLGKEGCYVTDFSSESTVPTFDLFEPVDTTGAGDSFVGGLIFGLLTGWPLETAAVFANAVASFNITKFGATGGVPDFDVVYKFVTENCGGEARFPLNIKAQ